MTVKFIVAHRKDPNNVGDIAANPLQYFLPEDQYRTIDVAHLKDQVYDSSVPLILGGGGVLGNSFFGDVAAELLTVPDRQQLHELAQQRWNLVNSHLGPIHTDFHQQFQSLIARTLEQIPSVTGPKFIWGAGHNDNIETEKIKYSRFLGEYRAVGLRDYQEKGKYDWVPCASCMHPALRTQYPIRNDVIWFEHKKQLIREFGNDPIPRFVNSGSNIEQTIEILGSANIILTNSYHGAYWGTLLGKRVVVVEPWSTKFTMMKHPPAFKHKKMSWQDAVDTAKVYPYALAECITATEAFWNRIK